MQKYYQSIYLFCCRRLNGDIDTATDITQDVFLKLLENIQSVRKIGKFQNYLLTIAVNCCNNYFKKAKPVYAGLEVIEDAEGTDNTLEGMEQKELRAAVQSAISILPSYLWVIQIALTTFAIVAAIILGQWSAPFYYPLTVLAVVVPVLTLLGTMQISKSTLYDMWEIEQSSRTPLVKIIACRMLIMGIFDLLLITVIMLFVAYFYRQPVIEMVLYGMIPFNIGLIVIFYALTKMASIKHQVI